jgi:hypothetical protein
MRIYELIHRWFVYKAREGRDIIILNYDNDWDYVCLLLEPYIWLKQVLIEYNSPQEGIERT